jgi:site-specific DNA recombinase
MSANADRHEYADIYARLSLDRDGKTAIERQVADCRKWCESQGLIVRKVHVDRGKSGYAKGVERAGFDAALAAVTSGVVGTLVVWKTDRLSRQGMGQVGTFLDAVEAAGGRIYFVQDSLDTRVGQSRILLSLLSEWARQESKNISVRVSSAKAYLRTQGRWLGGAPPYGLANLGKGLLSHDPEKAPLVREIAERLLAGETAVNICRTLNERGVPSARGGEWQPTALLALAKSPTVAGLMPETLKNESGRWSATTVPWRDPETGETVSIMAEGHEPLVSPADQARIVALLEGRTASDRFGARRGVRSEARHLLTGVLRCATCGGRMSHVGNSYRCNSRRLGTTCSQPASAYRPALEDAVVRAFVNFVSNSSPDSPLIAAIADRWLARHDPEAVKRRATILQEVEDVRQRIASADHDHYVTGKLDEQRHALVTVNLVKRLSNLEKELASHPLPEANIGFLFDTVQLREAWSASTEPQRRELLRLALTHVEVTAQPKRGHRFDPASRLRFVWAHEDTKAARIDSLEVGA